MSVSAAVSPHAVSPEEPPAWVRYVVAQAEPRVLVAEPDALAAGQVVPRAAAAQPDALVGEQAGLLALAVGPDALVAEPAGLPEPDALVVAPGVPPAARAGLWFLPGEAYAWAVAVLPVLAAWAGLWFLVAAVYAWAVAVPPVRSGAPSARVACGLAARDSAGRLGVQVHWALQRVHLAARVSRPVWWRVGWGGRAHWALRLVWEAARRVLLAAWRVRARLVLRPAAPAARRVADGPRRVRDGFPHVRRDLPR